LSTTPTGPPISLPNQELDTGPLRGKVIKNGIFE
jgi:hypothetical protein